MQFPSGPERLQLGVGLDLQWGKEPGWLFDATHGDHASPRLVAFLEAHKKTFHHLFVSWQPRDRSHLEAEHYFAAYDDLFARVGKGYPIRALHQTALNLGALEPYDRTGVVALSNALARRYDLRWVNEDLGVWSIHGKPLPYPLPPYLTREGLRAAIAATREVARTLEVPLLVEFPGFSDGTAFYIGRLHAYDFFRELAEEADVAVTLDTGHLLSYQWVRGKTGTDLLGEIEKLPLDRCFEIHLSGCEMRDGRFFDLHHGVLLDAQLDLLRILLDRCPNVRAVTYEDPQLDPNGALVATNVPSFDNLTRVFS